MIRLLLLILFSLTSLIAAAAPSIQLPLDGYYRPGSYMPVLISTSNPIVLDASPGMTTTLPAIDNKIVPLFVLSSTADHLQCAEISTPLHPLTDDQKLIGVASHDDVLLTQLFPSKKIVQIDLNPSAPLPGPAIAWNSLDAILVDSIDEHQLFDLLPTGTTIAVRSEKRPNQFLTWQRIADAWVLFPNLSPDRPGLMGETAYEPIQSWNPSRSIQARQLIVLIAILVSCFMLAIALWRSRWATPVLVIFVALFCAGFQIWRSRHAEVETLTQQIPTGNPILSMDHWTYQASAVFSPAEMQFDGCTWPIFASPAHADKLHATLDCDATGQPLRIKYTLPPKSKMAFLTRLMQGLVVTSH